MIYFSEVQITPPYIYVYTRVDTTCSAYSSIGLVRRTDRPRQTDTDMHRQETLGLSVTETLGEHL